MANPSGYGRKIFRYVVRIIAGFLLLWILLGAGAWVYLITHKASLTARVNSFLNGRFQGQIHIRDIDISVWKNFPYPALQVNGVTVDDSVYARTGRHTLYMEKIRIIPGFSGLFRGKPAIQKVVLENGGLFLYRDSSGYSNSYAWSAKSTPQPTTSKASTTSSLPGKIQLSEVDISIADSLSHKFYHFGVHHLSLAQGLSAAQNAGTGQHESATGQRDSLTPAGHPWQIALDVTVGSLALNTGKGSFLKDQEVRGQGTLNLSIGKGQLSFQGLALTIGGQALVADGAFDFNKPGATDSTRTTSSVGTNGPAGITDSANLFSLHLAVASLDFPAGRSWLPQKISRKLDSINFAYPIAVDARIDGRLSGGGEPKIRVDWSVRKNNLTGYIGTLYDCSFTGYFINTANPQLLPSDANSQICAVSMEGKYENSIAFHTRRLEINRLDTPVMVFDLGVHNDIAPWEDLLQSEDLSFDHGTVDMDLSCRYPLTYNSAVMPELSGMIRIKDAKINYIPRHVAITDGQVELAFDHQDLIIRQFSGKIGKSPITLNGTARNFLAMANTDTAKMLLDWNLYSPSLDLGELLPFLGKGSARRTSRKSTDTPTASTASATANGARNRPATPAMLLDRYVRRCKVNTKLHLDHLFYNHFAATDVNAALLLNNGQFTLQRATLQMAQGSIALSGSLSNDGGEDSKARLNAVLTHLDLPTLFYAFDNFGQQSLGSHNLAGILNARADLSMLLTSKGRKVPGSLEGSLDFTIDQGALLNFSPLMKLSSFALKNRDLSHVYFSQLHDIFGFSKDTVAINKMEIQSSVLEMFVEGMYKLDGAYTNADIQVPFNNLLGKHKRKKDSLKNVGVDAHHGLSIYVHAYNTGAEPLHYKFGLFKKQTLPSGPSSR